MKIQFTRENKRTVTKGTIGLFLEDINYGLDGGLNAEMLETPISKLRTSTENPETIPPLSTGVMRGKRFRMGTRRRSKSRPTAHSFPKIRTICALPQPQRAGE